MKGYELIGKTAAELMDRVETDRGQDDDNYEIAEVMIVMRIQEHEKDGAGYSQIVWRASDPVITHQMGLLQRCLNGLERDHRDSEED